MKSIEHITVTNQTNPVSLRQLPALRLTFLVAAGVLLSGVVGTVLVHQYFLVLPGFVATGLIVAATTGVCPLTAIIERLWRR